MVLAVRANHVYDFFKGPMKHTRFRTQRASMALTESGSGVFPQLPAARNKFADLEPPNVVSALNQCLTVIVNLVRSTVTVSLPLLACICTWTV